ncbi:ferric reductase-like transmembrane domain-containing protein [Paraburkholderia sp. SIMBA_054]|uniref:ferric reductase-like transmembrane domain-containing protein n=1 Tax=Paraburkholderia sp. SIMBA_054 TaxID=3085795 RepID=UPI00397AEC47
MKKITLSYFVLLSALTLLWLLADTVFAGRHGFPDYRNSIVYLTGVLAIGCMSDGMFLSIRPVSVEPFLGGLDKTYRLHKWLGVSALVLSMLHWLCVKVPKWLAQIVLLRRPVHAQVVPVGGTIPEIFNFLHSQHRLADNVGTWAFYASVVLIVIALLKRFPYRHFFKTHRFMAIA